MVRADRGQIEQVIINLAVNARDAMEGGGKLILETRNVTLNRAYASQHPGAAEGEFVMMAVTDSGVGMRKLNRYGATEQETPSSEGSLQIMSPDLGGESARDLAHGREYRQPPATIAYGLHREGDAPALEERVHEAGIDREPEEGEEDQTLLQIRVLFFCGSVDLDDEFGVFVDAPDPFDHQGTGRLVLLVDYARRLPGPGLDQYPVPGAGKLVHGVRGQRNTALARRPFGGHPDPHEERPPRASETAATAASKNTGSCS